MSSRFPKDTWTALGRGCFLPKKPGTSQSARCIVEHRGIRRTEHGPQNESTVTCKDKNKSQRKGKSPKIKSMWSEDEAFIYVSVLSSIVKMEETSLGL